MSPTAREVLSFTERDELRRTFAAWMEADLRFLQTRLERFGPTERGAAQLELIAEEISKRAHHAPAPATDVP